MLMKESDFDSKEEWYFYNWLIEAEEYGLVKNIVYHPASFQLSERISVKTIKKLKTKIKEVDMFVFHPHEYTADFEFVIASKMLNEYFTSMKSPLLNIAGLIHVDIKGGFQPYQGEAAKFSVNQKWVYQKFGVYIEKVIPEKLFKKTWVPEIARITSKQRKIVKKYQDCKNITEFYNELLAEVF